MDFYGHTTIRVAMVSILSTNLGNTRRLILLGHFHGTGTSSLVIYIQEAYVFGK